MSELGKVLKLARAKKQEALKKAEQEAKKKEAMLSEPMTAMQNLAAAIKKGKEQKKAREEAERLKKEQEEKRIIEEIQKDKSKNGRNDIN